MSDKPKLSPKMQTLSDAIRARKEPPQAVFCGFDLWLEVCGSGHTSMCTFKAGGRIADGTEDPEKTVLVPVLAIGKTIVVGFDPTLPPDEFQLKP
ncbi:MAG TPA: hypothetical protein VFJ13_07465 [Paracoccaceae bacterium]|nr:hypothetical protein [Paracoccaceae bacterium]